MNREYTKRKATDTTNSSQDLSSSSDIARERKTELLKKARKKHSETYGRTPGYVHACWSIFILAHKDFRCTGGR
ncbi:hypothetical protein BaRGS_00037506 [Batillaria attramentaria]|uniref:Uncharacterized protein n=1 Tax=Batillaria attramentaria TaxID=370345 RepID=A0ABD0J8W0_9CAEN